MASEFDQPIPIYPELDLQGDSQKWEDDRQLRIQRLREVVNLNITRKSDELTDEGKAFIEHAMSQLLAICNAKYQQIINNLRVFPQVDLSITEDGREFSYLTANFSLNFHTSETLKAADILLNSLTPEFDLSTGDSFDTAKKKARLSRMSNRVDINPNGVISFSTVLPGIYIEYRRPMEEPKKSVTIAISAFTEKMFKDIRQN